MTQTSVPRKASFPDKDASTSSNHNATDVDDHDEGAGEATELLVKHSPNEETHSTGSRPLSKCNCRTLFKCSRLEHDSHPFLPGENNKLGLLACLSYLLVVATFILFFVVHDLINLRCDVVAQTGNGTEEGTSQGSSRSDLQIHGLFVFVRGILGCLMGYLMGSPMKRLADGEGAIVESLKRENRNRKERNVSEHDQIVAGNGGQVIFDASGEGETPVSDTRATRDQSLNLSSNQRDDAVINIDPIGDKESKAKNSKEGETSICDICHYQYEKDGPVKEGALTKDDRTTLDSRTVSIVMLGLGRLLLVALMAALGVWWE